MNGTRVQLSSKDNVEDALLTIEKAELSDRNFYNCTVTNEATGFVDSNGHKYTMAEDATYVRVKGK